MERRFLSYDNYRTVVDPPYNQQPVSFDQAALLAKQALDALGVAQSSTVTPHLLQHGGSIQSREPEIESYSTGLPQPCSSNQIWTSAAAGNNANVNPQGGVGPETRVEGGMQDGSDSEDDMSFCKVCNLPLDSLQKYQRHIRSVGHSQRQMEFDQQKAPHGVHPPGPQVLPHSQQGHQGQYRTIHEYRQEKQQQQGNKLQQENQKQFGNQQPYLNQQHHGNQLLQGHQQQYGNQQQHGNRQEIGKQQHYDSVRRTGPGPSGVQYAPQQQGQYRREPEQHAYQRQQHGNRQGLDDPKDRLLLRHKGETTECPQEAGEENQMEEEEEEEEEDKDDANDLFRCELCDINTTCAATLRAHYQGRFHKAVQVALDDKTMVTQRFAARLGPKTLLPPIQRPTANLRLSVRKDGPSVLLIMLTDVTVPIVGVRYVREFQLFQQVNFHCMSCDCNCDSAAIKPHLISTKHRMRYLRDHHPDVYELVKSHNGTKMELAVFVENICTDVEKEVGRGKPVLGPPPQGPTGGKERRSEDEDLSKKEDEADKQEEEKSKPEETEKKDAPRGEGAAVKHEARPTGQDRGRAGPAFPFNRKVYLGKLPHDVAMAIYEEDKRRKELGGPPPPGWEPERRHHFLDGDPYLHEMRGPEFPPVRAWTPYMSEDERQHLLFELERGFLHDLPISLHPEEARCAMFPHYEKLGLPFEAACERVAMQEERRSRLMEYMCAGLSLQEALHKITAVESRKQLIREYEQLGLPPREARWRAIVEEERSGLLEEYARRGVNPLEVRARIMTGEERANLVGRFEKHGMPPAEAERRAIDEEERLKAIENSLQRGLVEEQGGGRDSMLDNVRDKWLLENHMEQGLSREKAENKVISHLRQEGVPTQAAILRVQRVTVQVPDPTSTHVDTSTAEAVSGTSKPVIDYRNLSPGKAKKHLLEEFEAGGVPREQALQILIRELVQTGMPEHEARQRFGEVGLAGEQAGHHKTKRVACVPTPSCAYSDIVSDPSRSPSSGSSPSYGSRSSSRSRSRSLSRGHHNRGLLSADSRSRSFSSGSRGWGSSTGRRKRHRHRSRSSDSCSRESRRKHHRRRSNSGSRGQSFQESSRRSRVKGHRSRSPSLRDDDRPPRHKQRARSHMEVDEGRADLHREVTRRDSRGDLETGQTEASLAEGAVDVEELRKNVVMELIKSGMPPMTVLQLFSQQLDQTAGGQDSGSQDTGPQQPSSSHSKVAQSTVSEIDSLYEEWKDRGGNTGHRQKCYRVRDDTDSSDSDADDRSRVSRRGGDRDGRGRNRDYSFTDKPNSDKKTTAYLGSHRNRMIAPRQETESSESDGNDRRRERPDPADSKAGQSQKHAGTSKLIVFDMKSDNFSVKKKPVKPVNVFGLTAESDSDENAEEGGGRRWRTAAGKKIYRDLTVTVHNSSAPAENSILDKKDTRDNHERERSNLDKDNSTLRRGIDRGRDSTNRDGNGRGKDERTAPGSRDRRDWRDRRGSRERRGLGDTMDVSNRRERVRRDRSNSRDRKYGRERVNDNWTVWLDKGDHRASRVWSDRRDRGNRRDRSNSRDRSHRRDHSNSRDRSDQRDGRDRRDQRDGRDRRDRRDDRDRRDRRDSRDRRDRRNSWDRRECGNNRERQVHRDVSDRKRVDSTATRWRGGPGDARNQPGKGDARHGQTGYHLQGRRWEQAAKESGGGSSPEYPYDDSSRAISTAPPTHTATMAQHLGFPVGAPIPPTPAEGAYPPAAPQQPLPFWAATQPTLGAPVPAPHRIFPIHVPTQPTVGAPTQGPAVAPKQMLPLQAPTQSTGELIAPQHIFPICAPTQPTADRPTQMTAVQQESTQSTPIPITATGPDMGALSQLADSYSLEETTCPDASETTQFKESSSLEETTGPNVSEPMQLPESSSLEGATGPNTSEPVQLAESSSLEGATGPNASEPVQLAESHSLEGATGPKTSEPIQLAESHSLEEATGPNASEPIQLAESYSLEATAGPNVSEPVQQIPVLQRRCSDSAEPKQGPAKRKARKGQKRTWAQIQAKRKEMKAKQGISTRAKKKAEEIQKKAEQIQEKAIQIQEKAEPQMTEVQTKKAARTKAKKTTPVPVETYVLKDDPPEMIAGSLAERLGKSLQDFTDATLHDSTMAYYRAQAKTGQHFPHTDSSKPTFEQVNGVIVRHHYHRKEKLQAKSIVVPKEFREQAILMNHQKPDGQHRILKSTVELVAYQYFWPKLHFEVKQFVRNCTLCKGKKFHFERLVVVRK